MIVDDDAYDPAPPRNLLLTSLTVIGRLLGLVVVGCGIWALAGAIYIAWGLVRDPASITYFARYFLEATDIAAHLPNGGEGLAHYVAWAAVLLLLLVLGKLGSWAVGAGSRLLVPEKR